MMKQIVAEEEFGWFGNWYD